jgi:hypothetical protein
MRFLLGLNDEDVNGVAAYSPRLRGLGRDRKAMRSDGVVVD